MITDLRSILRTKSTYMNSQKTLSFSIKLLTLIGAVLLQIACSESVEEQPLQSLANISEIKVLDNGNSGNASDIEVNFEKQAETNDVLEYRVFLTKSAVATSFDLSSAQSSSSYERATPDDIFTVQGLVLNSNFTDTEGDKITSQESYIVSVLSVPKNKEVFAEAFLKTTSPFRIIKNNLIKNHTLPLQVGMGSLAIDESDNLYMATNNVISEINSDREPEYPVFIISPVGDAQAYSQAFSVLGGIDIDSDGNIYQAVLNTGKVIKIDKQGNVSNLINEDDNRGFKLESVDGIFVDQNDQVFVLDVASNSVVKIDKDGLSSQFVSIAPHARGITGDKDGNLYISHNSEQGLITKVSSTGAASELATIPTLGPENYPLEFLQWVGYIKYHDGSLYVTSPSTNKVFRVSMSGDVSLFAGSGFRFKPRGAAISANLNRPHGLAFSKDGSTLYISGSADTEPRHTQSSAPSIIWSIELVE